MLKQHHRQKKRVCVCLCERAGRCYWSKGVLSEWECLAESLISESSLSIWVGRFYLLSLIFFCALSGPLHATLTHTPLSGDLECLCEALTVAFKLSSEMLADRGRIIVQPSMEVKTNTCWIYSSTPTLVSRVVTPRTEILYYSSRIYLTTYVLYLACGFLILFILLISLSDFILLYSSNFISTQKNSQQIFLDMFTVLPCNMMWWCHEYTNDHDVIYQLLRY